MNTDAILLVGNSPNRLSKESSSWSVVLASLRKKVGLSPDGHEGKPFTLHFEEMLNVFLNNGQGSKVEFLEAVAAMTPRPVGRVRCRNGYRTSSLPGSCYRTSHKPSLTSLVDRANTNISRLPLLTR